MNAKATLDLISVDILEGLSILTMLVPTNMILLWNKFEESFLKPVFVFAEDYF